MNAVTIERWAVVPAGHYDAYTAPELVKLALNGNVTGHPSFVDGSNITTSAIKGRDGEHILTKNTTYALGTPHPDYEKQFPNARARLLAQVDEQS